MAYTSRPCSAASRAVISEPLAGLASTTSTPSESPLMMRLRRGKFAGSGGLSSGSSETSAPPPSTMRRASLVAARIEPAQAGAEDCHGRAANLQRALVGGAIDSQGQPAGDGEAALRQAARKAPGGAQPGGLARRLPTIASCGRSRVSGAPSTYSSGGASATSASSAGYPGSSHISRCLRGPSSQRRASPAASRTAGLRARRPRQALPGCARRRLARQARKRPNRRPRSSAGSAWVPVRAGHAGAAELPVRLENGSSSRLIHSRQVHR